MTVPARHLRLVVSANPDHVVRSCVCVVSSDGIVLIGVSGEIDVETARKSLPQSMLLSSDSRRRLSSTWPRCPTLAWWGRLRCWKRDKGASEKG